jgi:signal transduction histidine kinase
MDLNQMRWGLRSRRPPIELAGFARTYQRMRLTVNVFMVPAVLALGRQIGGSRRRYVVPILVAMSLSILAHALVFKKARLAVSVTFDTLVYIAMAAVLDLPEVTMLVAISQSFLLFLHVRPRIAVRLLFLFMTVGVAAAIATTNIKAEQRTAGETALIVVIAAVMATLSSAWMLSQAAVEILRQREREEILSREKDRLLTDKDRFVASVSHELRTPLTAVVGLSHTLIERPDLTADERDEFVATIAEQSEEVAAIVDDLLVAARAGSGNLKLITSEVSIPGELGAVLPDTIPVVPPPGGVLTALGDPIRVRQILRNLLSNAARYGGPNQRVCMSQQGAMAVVEMQDDGPALPEAAVEAIFSAYGRAHDRPGRTDSVGLGLTVSRQLARMMGGDITYSHDGTWASFRLTLPRSASEAARAIADSPQLATAAHRFGV